MTIERKTDRAKESEGSTQAYMVAIVINDSPEILPVIVSVDFDDKFSQFITAEAEKLAQQDKQQKLAPDDQEKLEVLSGKVVNPVQIIIDEGEIKDYKIKPLNEFTRLEREWFEMLEDQPELCEMCEKDKKHYDIVFRYFKLRYENANQDPTVVSNLASEFSDGLDEDVDFKKLKPYFETVTGRFYK